MLAVIINIAITAFTLRSRISAVGRNDTVSLSRSVRYWSSTNTRLPSAQPTNRVAFVVFPLVFIEWVYELASAIFYHYTWTHDGGLPRRAYQIESLVGLIIYSVLFFIVLLLVLLLLMACSWLV
jgi:hypothetical protein